jgi:hypothetical protein
MFQRFVPESPKLHRDFLLRQRHAVETLVAIQYASYLSLAPNDGYGGSRRLSFFLSAQRFRPLAKNGQILLIKPQAMPDFACDFTHDAQSLKVFHRLRNGRA